MVQKKYCIIFESGISSLKKSSLLHKIDHITKNDWWLYIVCISHKNFLKWTVFKNLRLYFFLNFIAKLSFSPNCSKTYRITLKAFQHKKISNTAHFPCKTRGFQRCIDKRALRVKIIIKVYRFLLSNTNCLIIYPRLLVCAVSWKWVQNQKAASHILEKHWKRTYLIHNKA